MASLLLGFTCAAKAFAQDGFALEFDGSNDFVAVPDTGGFDFESSFTVEAWIKPFSLTGTEELKGIIQGAFTEPPFGGGGWALFLQRNDASMFGLSVCVPGCNAAQSSSGDLAINEWQHVAGVYGSGMITLYKNGVEIASAPQTGNVTNVDVLLLGIWDTSFQGRIDEVRIWNIARGGDEIQADMHIKLEGNEPGLVAYWNFDEGEGQKASDVTPNHNDGRLGSTPGDDESDPLWVNAFADTSVPFRRGDANASVSILMDRPDLVVAQAVFHGEIGETLAVEAADTLVPTSEPVVALAVFEDGAHGLEPEPWRRTDGAVFQLRSRHVLLRRAGGCGDKGKHDDCCQWPTQLTARHQLLHVNNGPSSSVSRNARPRGPGPDGGTGVEPWRGPWGGGKRPRLA